MVVGVWVALTGTALLVANALDSPVGEGARDKAQPIAPGTAQTTNPGVANLPPFAMVLDHPLPAGVAGLAPAQQAEELRTRAMSTRSSERFVELGSVLQVLGDAASAEFSYQAALKFDPQSVAAQVGLAVVDGTTGADGLAMGAARLRALATAHPRDQLVSFNQAWVEIYRGRGGPARAALKRTVALDPATRLGRGAGALLAASEGIRTGPNP
jgi:cytochrome c-type biogenesis protein CcmH/NrfG